MTNDRILATLQELARRLRVPVRWLRNEADAGRLPHVRAGAQRLFNVVVVERVLAARADVMQRDTSAAAESGSPTGSQD